MKPDIEALRRAIEMGVIEAAHDAGFERIAVRVDISTLLARASNGVHKVPAIHVEVLELTPEQARELIDSDKDNN